MKHVKIFNRRVAWESGLEVEVMREVEGYLVKGRDDEEGITGEGSMIQQNRNKIQQKKSTGLCF